MTEKDAPDYPAIWHFWEAAQRVPSARLHRYESPDANATLVAPIVIRRRFDDTLFYPFLAPVHTESDALTIPAWGVPVPHQDFFEPLAGEHHGLVLGTIFDYQDAISFLKPEWFCERSASIEELRAYTELLLMRLCDGDFEAIAEEAGFAIETSPHFLGGLNVQRLQTYDVPPEVAAQSTELDAEERLYLADNDLFALEPKRSGRFQEARNVLLAMESDMVCSVVGFDRSAYVNLLIEDSVSLALRASALRENVGRVIVVTASKASRAAWKAEFDRNLYGDASESSAELSAFERSFNRMTKQIEHYREGLRALRSLRNIVAELDEEYQRHGDFLARFERVAQDWSIAIDAETEDTDGERSPRGLGRAMRTLETDWRRVDTALSRFDDYNVAQGLPRQDYRDLDACLNAITEGPFAALSSAVRLNVQLQKALENKNIGVAEAFDLSPRIDFYAVADIFERDCQISAMDTLVFAESNLMSDLALRAISRNGCKTVAFASEKHAGWVPLITASCDVTLLRHLEIDARPLTDGSLLDTLNARSDFVLNVQHALPQIPVERISVKGVHEPISGSWKNTAEAQAVLELLSDRAEFWQDAYNGQKISDIVQIATPYIGGAESISHALSDTIFEDVVVTALPMTLAQPKPILIWAHALDSDDPRPYFFDRTPQYLNRLLSLARDRFVFVGDPDRLKPAEPTPSGALGRLLMQQYAALKPEVLVLE